ncbi:uncharacterized protein DUF2867 [Calidifontibacter indicus]|uniref:Uncharacterized protein DUF2867 n=2 Tax=Calidifontibacter indicus TaxID=419650 RepID=A0A3D9UIJ1_9MICO|nr:uncharacterized protein DUF2867 [Calidifontibacter indicus]
MVTFQDEHTVALARAGTALEFAHDVLGSAPEWLHALLGLRDAVVGRLGFAVQTEGARDIDLRPGGSAGPFTFSRVDDDGVTGGATDRHMAFESTFYVTHDKVGPRGHLLTTAHSRSSLGAAYLRVIWPFHTVLMGRILRSGAARSDLRIG